MLELLTTLLNDLALTAPGLALDAALVIAGGWGLWEVTRHNDAKAATQAGEPEHKPEHKPERKPEMTAEQARVN